METKTTNRKNLIFIAIGIVLFAIAFIYSYNVFKAEGESRSVFVEKIQDGDFVWSLNSLKEQVELNEVHHTFCRESNSWLEIEVGQLKIVVTAEHPFYIVGKGWVEAQYLAVDDEVLCDV